MEVRWKKWDTVLRWITDTLTRNMIIFTFYMVKHMNSFDQLGGDWVWMRCILQRQLNKNLNSEDVRLYYFCLGSTKYVKALPFVTFCEFILFIYNITLNVELGNLENLPLEHNSISQIKLPGSYYQTITICTTERYDGTCRFSNSSRTANCMHWCWPRK